MGGRGVGKREEIREEERKEGRGGEEVRVEGWKVGVRGQEE